MMTMTAIACGTASAAAARLHPAQREAKLRLAELLLARPREMGEADHLREAVHDMLAPPHGPGDVRRDGRVLSQGAIEQPELLGGPRLRLAQLGRGHCAEECGGCRVEAKAGPLRPLGAAEGAWDASQDGLRLTRKRPRSDS